MVAPPQGWDEKDERWKRAQPILARPHVLRRSGRQWFCEACDKRAFGGAAKSKLARTECVGHPATTLGEHAKPQFHLLALTGSFVWCCRCEARAAKFAKKLGEPSVGHRELERVREAFACCRVVGIPKRIDFLVRRNFSRCKHGQGGGKATKGTTATGLGWLSSGRQ